MIKKLFFNLSLLVMFALAAIMLAPAALGYHRYVILTGSMTGTYDRGSVVFDKPVPTSDLRVGDAITYSPPPGASPNQRLVTHRIHGIQAGPAGQRVYVTKGDANAHPDAWKFTLPQPTQDTVRFHLPYVGYVFMVLQVRVFRTALIGIPALLMALWFIVGLWREGGRAVGRRRAGLGPQVASEGVAPAEAGRAPVRLPVTWPDSDIEVASRRIKAGFVSPLARRGRREPAAPGTVALPTGCVAARRTGRRRRPERLPADWRLVVDPRG